MLAAYPFGALVVAADELFEGVLLEHAAHADLALVLAVDLLLYGLGGVAGQVGQQAESIFSGSIGALEMV